MKYVDINAIVQVIGNIFLNPNLLDIQDKYNFCEEDFTEKFHKILFGSIYNLHALGADKIDISTIEDYLEEKPKMLAIYKSNRGSEYLKEISETVKFIGFDYYYGRMKKMTLLRLYESIGFDLSWLYDPDNLFDAKKKEIQEKWLDNSSLEDIADKIDEKIDKIKFNYLNSLENETKKAGDNILELIQNLQESPDFGLPLYGKYINTITRGARLKKFMIRSSSTGSGKTRSMIADCCTIGCEKRYDRAQSTWISIGVKEPVVFISTEQEIDEIQTMMLAFISDVNESHILYNKYEEGELERVIEAGKILIDSPIYIEEMSDFSISDVENTVKKNIRQYNCHYIILDYIHSSLKILEEISSKAKISNLREDNVLFILSTKLKNICNEYNVFILSATQLNGTYKGEKRLDQNQIRAAKSIIDKVDYAAISVDVLPEDLELLREIIDINGFVEPKLKMGIYKNRRGAYKNIYLWCDTDLGTCKINPLFATDYDYKLINLEDIQINIVKEENKKDIKELGF